MSSANAVRACRSMPVTAKHIADEAGRRGRDAIIAAVDCALAPLAALVSAPPSMPDARTALAIDPGDPVGITLDLACVWHLPVEAGRIDGKGPLYGYLFALLAEARAAGPSGEERVLGEAVRAIGLRIVRARREAEVAGRSHGTAPP